ncbi:hypothetical protein AVEN_167116-1 [Araneus ventricosus]|uniref:Uncharacterized protein n=1 Tax=Araneus ventricosus TaxID=182803 RepID=A0A4Y2LQ08_ARAVE|nr:hypothetical protein AVEN_167116-1 [Araneus ventricosus]
MGKLWFSQMYACPFECLALYFANANFKENCYLLNLDGTSFGIIGMCEIKTLSRFQTLSRRLDLGVQFVTVRSLGTSRLRINSTGTPTFNLSLSEGTPDNSKKLKNSTGYDVTCYCPLAYLQVTGTIDLAQSSKANNQQITSNNSSALSDLATQTVSKSLIMTETALSTAQKTPPADETPKSFQLINTLLLSTVIQVRFFYSLPDRS